VTGRHAKGPRAPHQAPLHHRRGGPRFAQAWLPEVIDMLNTLLIVLVVLWLLGMVSSYTLGGFIHLLLVLAVAVLLIRVIQGRNPI
jgi:hypothetical protein